MNLVTIRRSTTAREPARAVVKWREVIIFCVLAIGLTWLAWIPLVLPQLGQAFATGVTPNPAEAPSELSLFLGMFGPLVAAVIMRLFVSKEGLKGSLGLWRSWKYYLVAFAAPALFIAAVILTSHASGLGTFVAPSHQLPIWLRYVISAVVSVVALPLMLGEDYGWRGYLLPRLLPLGEIRGTMVLGLIHAAWHLPWLLSGLVFPGQPLLLVIVVFVFGALVFSFPYTWLSVASRGSAFLAAIAHGVLNVTIGYTSLRYIANGSPLFVSGEGGLISSLILLILTLVVYGIVKRSPRVEIQHLQPRLDGTWRDWLR